MQWPNSCFAVCYKEVRKAFAGFINFALPGHFGKVQISYVTQNTTEYCSAYVPTIK